MISPRRTPILHGHELSILGVLVLTFGVTGLLAYQAQQAIRSHRVAAEAALRDHAAFASWELGRRLDEAVQTSLRGAVLHARVSAEIELLTHPEAAHDGTSAARFRSALLEQFESCGCGDAVSDVFALDLEGGTASFVGLRRDAVARLDIAAVLRSDAGGSGGSHAVVQAPNRLPPRATIRGRADDATAADGSLSQLTVIRHEGVAALQPYVVRPVPGAANLRLIYTVLPTIHGRAGGAYGFVVDVPGYATAIVRDVVEHSDVLPPTLMRGRRNTDVLAVRVHTVDGEPLYRTDGVAGTTEVVDTVVMPLAALVTAIAVQPSEIATLLIGGLPASRLPLLLATFAITLILAAVAAVQLRRQRALARLRTDFVSGVSHELRTPLAQISMFAELLEQGGLPRRDEQRSIRIINEEAKRLRYLVENILHFSRSSRAAERGVRAPHTATALVPLVRDVVDGFAPLARRRNVTVTVHASTAPLVAIEPHALRQVLLNLLDNALKYGPSGQHVRVSVVCSGDDVVQLIVEDSGPGIPPEEREAVWQPYRRLARDVVSTTTGSGIGLAVVRDIVTAHGGRTHIAAGAGGGTRVIVELMGGGTAEPPAGEATPAPAYRLEPGSA